MKTNRRTETLSITPTPHISFPIGPLLLSEKMFNTLDLPSLFSPLKKKGIDISTLIKSLTAYKLSDNFSVQTKLVEMSEEEALAYLREKLNTGRGGFFALTSSRNLTLAEALERYRKKDSIEKIFHSLKNEVEIKPLRLWTENSIRGAIMIGFLAQLFVSLVRYEVPQAQAG